MLTQMHDDGTMEWNCPHCQTQNSAHVSDAHVEPVEGDPTMIALPPCACGSRTFLKIAFSESDLAAPIIHYDSLGQIVQVEVPGAPNFVKVNGHMEGGRIRRIDGVEWHPALAHHLAAARHLAAVGKIGQHLVRNGLPAHVERYPE